MMFSCQKDTECKHCWVVVAEGSPTLEHVSDMGTVCGKDMEYIESYNSGVMNYGYPDVGYCEEIQ